MRVLKNHNPTNAERRLFEYAGFYKTEESETCSKYMPIHTDTKNGFPKEVEVSDDDIEHGSEIIFYHQSEMMNCTGTFDKVLIGLIQDRMAEMDWK